MEMVRVGLQEMNASHCDVLTSDVGTTACVPSYISFQPLCLAWNESTAIGLVWNKAAHVCLECRYFQCTTQRPR